MKKFNFDTAIFVEGLIGLIVCAVIGSGCLIETVIRFAREDNEQAKCFLFLSVLCFLAVFLSLFSILPKVSSYYLIGGPTVIIKRGRQKLTVDIDFYKYVYYGYYDEGSIIGIRHRRGFIVISHYRMGLDALSRVNLQDDDKYLVRIKITKGAIRELECSLPERLKEQMLAALDSRV